jgi:hypothetical protein
MIQAAVGLLNVLLSLAGVAVCAVHLSRSRWVLPILVGFALEALTAAFYAVAGVVLSRGIASFASLGLVYGAASVVGFTGRAAVLLGLFGLLSELRLPEAPRDADQAP